MINVERFECQKCGECCRNMIVSICYSDFERWEREHRWDILSRVYYAHELISGKGVCEGFILREDEPRIEVCQFLSSGSRCLIYDTRPKVCRKFPLFSAQQKTLARCGGVGKGGKVNPKIIGSNSEDVEVDLSEALVHWVGIMAMLWKATRRAQREGG